MKIDIRLQNTYAKDNGVSQAAKFFKNKYPTINEPLCKHLSRSMTKT